MNRFKDLVASVTEKLRDNKGDSKMPLLIQRRNPSYWRVTLHHPPINLFDPEMVAGLQMLIERLEHDDQVKVVVFDSANPDFALWKVIIGADDFDAEMAERYGWINRAIADAELDEFVERCA